MTTEPTAPSESPTADALGGETVSPASFKSYKHLRAPRVQRVGPGDPGVGGDGFKTIPWASTAAIVGLFCCAGLAALAIYLALDVYWASKGSHAGAASAATRIAETERLSDMVNTIFRVAYVLTAVPFLIWFQRCYRNLARLHVDGKKYSSDWAVWGWFIPFFHLIRPYQVARESWDASNPDVQETEGPRGWLRKRSALLVQLWWVLHVAPPFVFAASSRFINQPSIEKWKIGMGLLIVGNLINIGAALSAMLVIRRLNARQAKRLERLRTIFGSHGDTS